MSGPGGAARAQRGIVAVEFALIIVLMFVMLSMTLAFARLFWHYNALQKASNDALRYMTSLPALEIMNTTSTFAAIATARAMVISAAQAAKLDVIPDSNLIAIDCSPFVCGTAGVRPATIQIRMTIELPSYILSDFIYLGSANPFLSIDSTAPYAN